MSAGTAQCLVHPMSEFYAVRDDFLAICEYDHAAAALLQRFEFWTNGLLMWAEAKRATPPKHEEIDLWMTRSIADLVEALRGLFGRNKIITARDQLVKWGFLVKHQPHKDRWQRKYQYRLNIEKVQAALDSVPIAAKDPEKADSDRYPNQDDSRLEKDDSRLDSNGSRLEQDDSRLDSNNVTSYTLSQIKYPTLDKESPEKESSKEPSSESSKEPPPTPPSPDDEDGTLSVKTLIELFIAEKFIRRDSPVGQQSVRELCQKYGLETVMEMLKAAVSNKARTLTYIQNGLEKNAAAKAAAEERARIHAEIEAYKASPEYQQQLAERPPEIRAPMYSLLKDWRTLSQYQRNGLHAIYDSCAAFLEKHPDHPEADNVRETVKTYKREQHEEWLKAVPIPTGRFLEDAAYMARWAQDYHDHPQLAEIMQQSQEAIEQRAKWIELMNAEAAERNRQEAEIKLRQILNIQMSQLKEPGTKVTQRATCDKLSAWVEENPEHEWVERVRQSIAEFKKRLTPLKVPEKVEVRAVSG